MTIRQQANPPTEGQVPAPNGNQGQEGQLAEPVLAMEVQPPPHRSDRGGMRSRAERETYHVPTVQQGLLLRAKETYSKRSIGNKYELIAKWLLTGLAVAIAMSNWNILSKHRTLTITPQNLLNAYFRRGYPAEEKDKMKKPYVLPHPDPLPVASWQATVSWISHARFVPETDKFNAARVREDYYYTINQDTPIQATPAQEQHAQSSSATDQSQEENSASSSSGLVR